MKLSALIPCVPVESWSSKRSGSNRKRNETIARKQGTMPTVTPPTGGLIGFSNYNLYYNCENLTGVSVTVDVTEGMVAIPSASFGGWVTE